MDNIPLRKRLFKIIFEAETKSGKLFDVILLILILISVFAIILESVSSIQEKYGEILYKLEWFFTILFSIEYLIRIYVSKNPIKYIFSFMGLVDFLSIIPTYLLFLSIDVHYLTIFRSIRLIRIFRIFHLSSYVRGALTMQRALRNARPKITVFLLIVVLLVVILGTVMYIIEGVTYQNPGFQDIPNSIYWAIVTLTTVGYGSIVPISAAGKILASVLMILGYGIIAVPTGIVSAELVRKGKIATTIRCSECNKEGHDYDSIFCKYCGEKM